MRLCSITSLDGKYGTQINIDSQKGLKQCELNSYKQTHSESFQSEFIYLFIYLPGKQIIQLIGKLNSLTKQMKYFVSDLFQRKLL